MRIALAQVNPILGDFKGNAAKIIEFCQRGVEKRADVIIFSELTLFGYPPHDLLEREEFVVEQLKVLQKVLKAIPPKITVVFGAVVLNKNAKKKGGKPYFNAAVVAQKGKRPQYFAKQMLPTYDIFDEGRFFEPGSEPSGEPAGQIGVIKINKVGRVAISVCEDMWANMLDRSVRVYSHDPLRGLKNIDLIINISASPFAKVKMQRRLHEARGHARRLRAPMAYVNQVGGQDELIFDGRSFVIDARGKVLVQAQPCSEDLVIIDLATKRYEYRPEEENPLELLRQNLVMGLRDFVAKTNQKRVHLGLSGGIDSALVASLAVDALGPNNVVGVLLPGPYSSEGSVKDALALAKNLNIKTLIVDIKESYVTARAALIKGGAFDGESKTKTQTKTVSLAEQNLQSRLRGLTLMAYSNSHDSMLLSTANKCELATGYATLYGDTNGGLMPIGDLVKGEIYALARLYNESRQVIPQAIIDKAPSAELAPHQKDEDSLPPYANLDQAVINIVELKKKAINKTEKWLVQALARSEFKRWQAPPILRVSDHSFGRGRRLPISRKV